MELKRSEWLPPYNVRRAVTPRRVARHALTPPPSPAPLSLLLPPSLPQDDGCRRLVAEVNAIYEEMLRALRSPEYDEAAPDPGIACGVVMHHHSLLRAKRCMLAYLSYRLDRVRQLRWETGPVVPSDLQPLLSGKEVEFFARYDGALNGYMGAIGDMDLTADPSPPKQLHVEVRVLEDCGEVVTEDGNMVNLEAHTTHYLRRADVEHLIRQGKLQQLDT